MTYQQAIENYLENNGVFSDEDRKGIMQYCKAHETLEPMRQRWNEDMDTQVITPVLINVRPLVVKWIDTNKPEAFYRPMFTKELN